MRNKDWRHNDEMDMRLKELEKSDRKYMDDVKGYKKPKHRQCNKISAILEEKIILIWLYYCNN